MTKSFDLKDKVVLVTGATQGIGKAVAIEAARSGATVVLLARHVKALESVYDQIVSEGLPEPAAIPMDLFKTTDSDFNQLALQIKVELGRLDAVVNCASYLYGLSPLANQTIDEWMNQYRINTVAPFALSKACLPLLKDSPDASVIFVGESHGQAPKAYWGGFGASKAGLAYLTQVAADEWDAFPNLRVNLLIPGPVNSPLRIKTHPGEDRSERADIEDIVPHFMYWLSPESAGQTGQIIDLDFRKQK